MNGPLLFGLFALIHLVVGLGSLSFSGDLLLPSLCLFIVETVTAFDNGVTAIGHRLGPGLTAERLSRARFLLHAVGIGLLVPVYAGIAGAIAFGPAWAEISQALAWVLATLLALYGYFRQYASVERLMPVNVLGCLRYAQSVTEATRWPGYDYTDAELGSRGHLPFASVATVTLGLLFGLIVGLMSGFWVLFIVNLLMFGAAAFPQRGWGPVATSTLELVFSAGLLYSLGFAAGAA